jgi:hypothetical protein
VYSEAGNDTGVNDYPRDWASLTYYQIKVVLPTDIITGLLAMTQYTAGVIIED